MTPTRQDTGHWGQSPALLRNQEKPHRAQSHPESQGHTRRRSEWQPIMLCHYASLPTSPSRVRDFFRHNPPAKAWANPSSRRMQRHLGNTWGEGCDGNSHPRDTRANTVSSHIPDACGTHKEEQCLFLAIAGSRGPLTPKS